MVKKARVLIVEDEALVAEDLKMAVTDLGYEVVGHADNAEEAVKKALKLKPDVILMDIVLKGEKTGIDASHEIKAQIDLPIIFLTAYTDIDLIDKAKSTEPYAYLVKPFQERQLLASIEMAMHKCQIETKLKESEEFSFSLQNNSPNPILVINPDSTVRYVNPALEKLTGFSSKEVIGKKKLYPWWTEEAPKKNVPFKAAMRKRKTKREVAYQKKTGERFWVEITTTPVKSNGEFKYYLVNWVDVSERKQAEEALQKAHDELELRVKERTAELERSNEQLRTEISEREQAEQKVKNLELSALHRLFKQGKCYLLVEEKPDTCFKLFNKLIEYGVKGMLISRIHPSQIQEEYNVKDIPTIWLTQVREENCIEPTNITQLSIAVKEFAEKGVECVILLEGLEYLIVQNGFEVVLRFVQTMADIVMISKCRLVISFDAQTLGEVELHRLERELNVMNANEVKVLILD
jgi:PAS domain S-box-containing protein